MSKNNLEHLTFKDYIDQFLEDRKMRGRLPKTIQYYQSELTYFDRWLDKNELDKNIELMTSNILKQYFVELSKQGRNKGGVHASFRAVKAFLNWYDFEFEPVWKNPIRKVKISPNRIDPLPEIPLATVQELLRFCSGKYELRDRGIIFTLVDVGLRATELTMLNVGDIDLITGKVQILHGKGNRSRICWIGEKGRKVLKEYLKTRINLQDDQPLFLNSEKQRLSYQCLRDIFKRLYIKSKVKERGLHSFRRLFGLTIWRKTHDIVLASRLLGHHGTAVTLRYLNLSNEDLQLAHESNSPADDLV